MKKVLFITLDQWRADCAGFAGHQTVQTPNIDALAAAGRAFPKHFTCASPCGPSRASLLSGLYAMTHRVHFNAVPLDERFECLPQVARAAGMEPVLFGYTDTARDPRNYHSNDPDLTSYEMPMVGFTPGSLFQVGNNIHEWTAYLRRQGYKIQTPPSEMIDNVTPFGDSDFATKPAPYKAEHSETSFLADRVIEYFTEYPDKSWLIHASFLRPHPPFQAPEPYNDMYDVDDLPDPVIDRAALRAQHPYLDLFLGEIQERDNFFQRGFGANKHTHQDRCNLRNVYYGLITECDTNLGRIFAALKQTGQWDDTLVVLTSDHGEMLGKHHMWSKMMFYDQSWRVPLIVRDPYADNNRAFSGFSSSVDIAPTIARWIGQPVPDGWDGMDLLAGDHGRDAAFCELDFRSDMPAQDSAKSDHQYAIWRTDKWKLVFFVAWPTILFDMENDPHEQHNLAGDPQYQSVIAELQGQMLAHRMRHAEHHLSRWKIGPKGALRK